MQIVLGKTVVGDFLVGKLESKKDLSGNDIPIIADAYSLIVIPDPNNREQMKTMILPLLYPFDDKAIKEVTFDKIFAVVDAPQDIQNVYIKITTGIDVVPANTKIIQ
jgi:hypothetical protein